MGSMMRVYICLAVWFTTQSLSVGAQSEDDYSALIKLSYSFYQGQMSGKLPSWNALLYDKPGGYKKDSHLDDGKPIGKDLSGGFYDAGDYLKCPHPLGWTIGNHVLSCLEFEPAIKKAGQWDTALRIIKWGADWMMKAHVTASDTPGRNEFVGQVSDKSDHNYFGRPELAKNERPVYLVDSSTGGADVASEYAAAFAAAAVLFKAQGDREYADELYKHAEQAFGFAEAHQKNWVTPSGVFQAYITFWPKGYLSHMAWAAAWMCKYDSAACGKADKYWDSAVSTTELGDSFGYDWDSVLPGAAALMLNMKRNVASAKEYLEDTMLSVWEDTSNKCPKPAYSTVCYTPKGLAYYSDWGTLRSTANAMFIATLAGKYGDKKDQHICWARSQMRYALGSLPGTGKSYVIGYGPDQPQRPHHRPSACNPKYEEPCQLNDQGQCCVDESGVGKGGCCDSANFFNTHPALIKINGALVGGPDQTDTFPDKREDFQRSEVALDYNAGFTGAAAGLAFYADDGQLRSCGAGTPPASAPRPSPSTSPKPSPGPAPAPAPGSPPPTGTPPPAAGGDCSNQVAVWQVCGGKSNGCSGDQCIDGRWEDHCCSSGNTCTRINEWYWQCLPSTSQGATQATASSPATSLRQALNCTSSLGVWDPCGGDGEHCPAVLRSQGKCQDTMWEGHCCPSGSACVRESKDFYQCQPALQASDATGQVLGVTGDKHDSLAIMTPHATDDTIKCKLTRHGKAVKDAEVQVTITTMKKSGVAQGTATIRGSTNSKGVADLRVPRKVVGSKGDMSVISAVSTDARAVGVKGTVVAEAPDVELQW